ncbi:hssA/2C/7E family protein [Cavenderia fasciculata]|uniref:HssA/2C/7E family protein n=1 Tax=Cavenderia fasciculata TaxID=261658 RepID=F4PIV0_CACFS|nr:hssA/2C/7E family protein [Cavenderia fasciculata]EGG24236.1 hssA/2C/7E family protein [Cavenderia fasciculata]|eukprot:XP_004362087.1 hssA/2C/7E family protein [Cavenderia fasciculata]
MSILSSISSMGNVKSSSFSKSALMSTGSMSSQSSNGVACNSCPTHYLNQTVGGAVLVVGGVVGIVGGVLGGVLGGLPCIL